ncbi:MAG: c-type cytochrome [Campylobacterota bacterium]|nr:c-type cytochrome [Campylobacterota bacterium]
MKSQKIIITLLTAVSLLSGVALADVKKGQKAFLKTCKKCHGNGTKGAAMKTQDEWEELFDDNAELLIEAHKGDKSEKFFAGKKFKKLSPHLKDFLYEYASDSGNVPSCG